MSRYENEKSIFRSKCISGLKTTESVALLDRVIAAKEYAVIGFSEAHRYAESASWLYFGNRYFKC